MLDDFQKSLRQTYLDNFRVAKVENTAENNDIAVTITFDHVDEAFYSPSPETTRRTPETLKLTIPEEVMAMLPEVYRRWKHQ